MTIEVAKQRLLNTAWLGTNEDRETTEEAVRVLIKAVEQEPKTVSIPEGATNGDAVQIMFNKTFPKTIILYKNDESRLTINPMFSREWWEMPYKESEGKE